MVSAIPSVDFYRPICSLDIRSSWTDTGDKLAILWFYSTDVSQGTFSDFWKAEFDANIPYTEGPFLLKEVWQEDLPQSGYSGLDLCLDVFADQPSGSVLISTAVPYVNLNDSVPNVNSEKVILVSSRLVHFKPQSSSTNKLKSIKIYRGVPSRFVQDRLAFYRA